MTFDPNDPRLTAFVLGELDPDESAAVETMLGESAECRQAVEEIRQTVGWLTSRLHQESEGYAPPAEVNHQAIGIAIATPPVAANRSWWRKHHLGRAGLAASLLLFGSIAACRTGRNDESTREDWRARRARSRSARPPKACQGCLDRIRRFRIMRITRSQAGERYSGVIDLATTWGGTKRERPDIGFRTTN